MDPSGSNQPEEDGGVGMEKGQKQLVSGWRKSPWWWLEWWEEEEEEGQDASKG